MTALSPVQNAGICQDVLSFPVMEEAPFLPCGREGVGLSWPLRAQTPTRHLMSAVGEGHFRGQAAEYPHGMAVCSCTDSWMWLGIFSQSHAVLVSCRSACASCLHPQPLALREPMRFSNTHSIALPRHRTTRGVFSVSGYSPNPNCTFPQFHIRILMSAHLDSHRINETCKPAII